MAKELLTEEMALRRIEAVIGEAAESGKFMVVVWQVKDKVKDKRVEMVDRVTWKFPRGDFLAAISQLARACATEVEESSLQASEPPAPLPRAIDFSKVSSDGLVDQEAPLPPTFPTTLPMVDPLEAVRGENKILRDEIVPAGDEKVRARLLRAFAVHPYILDEVVSADGAGTNEEVQDEDPRTD